ATTSSPSRTRSWSVDRAPRQVPSKSAALPPDPYADQLVEEQALISAAQLALRQGSPGTALANLALHKRRYPRGQLAPERDALEIQTLVMSGHVDEARAHTMDFERQFPRSFFRTKVELLMDQSPRNEPSPTAPDEAEVHEDAP